MDNWKIVNEQIDDVAMGSPLGPLTANTLMCSIEEKLAHENKLHNFVDDTSALVPDLTALTSFFRGPCSPDFLQFFVQR